MVKKKNWIYIYIKKKEVNTKQNAMSNRKIKVAFFLLLSIGMLSAFTDDPPPRNFKVLQHTLKDEELDEIMELSDRIAVMYRGKILAVVPNKGITKEYIGLLMAGVVPEEPLQESEETEVEATL